MLSVEHDLDELLSDWLLAVLSVERGVSAVGMLPAVCAQQAIQPHTLAPRPWLVRPED